MRHFSLLICLIVLVGCSANKPNPEQIKSAEFGPYPENYKTIIEENIKSNLIDPNSSMLTNWRGPTKGYAPDGNGAFVFGYVVCVEVNSKNRMGGYAGKQPYFFVIKDGSIAKYDHANYGDTYSEVKAGDLRQVCATLPPSQ